MCGIVGLFNSASQVDEAKLIRMRDVLQHRGPDGAGMYISPDRLVGLGHRRLSIIDLSEDARQPMSNEDGNLWITYNGEIYNFEKLRKELIEKGHQFRSKSDTEVIVHAYEEWGADCVKRLRGMFAFGIWDNNKREVFLARDSIGIKPLFYYAGHKVFRFASEAKAIIADDDIPKNINIPALCDFFFYRYIPSPNSIWNDVKKLNPGCILLYKDGKTKIERYWSPQVDCKDLNEKDALQLLDERLNESIQVHQVSDVPVGLLLSGGLDSSTIAYYMKNQNQDVQAFTIGFESKNEWYNELPYAQQIADLFCKDFKQKVVKAEVWELLPKLMWFYDEPFGDGSMLPSYMVSSLARKHVKTVLGGDGGDEIFAGYNRYFVEKPNAGENKLDGILKLLLHKQIQTSITRMYLRTMTPFLEVNDLKKILHPDFKAEIRRHQEWFLDKNYNDAISTPKDLQTLDLQTILPEQYLTKIDRASMANSLEVRVPMLDIPLVEFMLSLPVSVYLGKRQHKYLLKELMKNRLPKRILDRKKRGFSIPLGEFWDRNDMANYILNGPSVKSGIIRKQYIKRLSKISNGATLHQLWQIAIFDAWCKAWL